MVEKEWTVLSEGYHGHHDSFVSLTPPHWGVPADCKMEKLDHALDPEQIRRASAVIIEPIMTDMTEKRREWLQRLRDLCTEYETVLIFDEVITGFRVPKYTVSQYWNIEPDLVILGKATAGGLPLAIVGGPSAILDGDYFISGTYFGDTLALSAMRQIIKCLHTPDYDLNTLWKRGGWFLERFNADAARIGADVKIEGYNTRGSFAGNDRHLFFQEACKAGVLFGPSWFYNFPLMQYDDIVLNICASIFQRIKSGEAKFHGEKPVSPFATKVRENGKT